MLSALFLSVAVSAQSLDSLKMRALGLRLSEYYDALKHESIDVQKNECDFLIESSSDSLIRQFIALDILRHYLASDVMGAENVAVHVFDKWFADHKIRMKSEEDFMAAKVFAEFNRRSLIGEKAPALDLEAQNGEVVSLYGPEDPLGRFRILFFYDADCPKCKVETIFLNNLFDGTGYPVEIYAVYTGDDRKAWDRYVSERIRIDSLKVTHLWDPALDSDFQRKYGVVQTPRLFLVGPDGVILGRGLDVKALEKLLEGIFAERKLEYGGPESVALFDGIFSSSDGVPSVGQVKGIADYIHDRTLVAGDTLMFRQMAGDYLYYLASHTGEGYKEGLRYHISKNIRNDSKIWKSADDSLKVLGFADIMSDLLSRAVPGTLVPAIKVTGRLYTWRSDRETTKNLRKLKGKTNIIIFYTDGCEVCAAQKKAALEILAVAKDESMPESERMSARRTEVFMVNMDTLMASAPSLASRLMDSFDLSSLPFVLITDSDGTVVRRYVLF